MSELHHRELIQIVFEYDEHKKQMFINRGQFFLFTVSPLFFCSFFLLNATHFNWKATPGARFRRFIFFDIIFFLWETHFMVLARALTQNLKDTVACELQCVCKCRWDVRFYARTMKINGPLSSGNFISNKK